MATKIKIKRGNKANIPAGVAADAGEPLFAKDTREMLVRNDSGTAQPTKVDQSNIINPYSYTHPANHPASMITANAISGITGTDVQTILQNLKAYTDSIKQSLDIKDSVKAASTANIATLSGAQTIDGVSLIAGDRVLLKDQSTASQNGIWIVNTGAWTRPSDYTGTNVTAGAYTFVEGGSINADSGWVCTSDTTITVDTTATVWMQFSGAGQITAGAGLTKSGNTLNVNTASSARIVVNADNIDLAVSGVTAGAKGSATKVPAVTVDSYGRVTAISENDVAPSYSSITGKPTTVGGLALTDFTGLGGTPSTQTYGDAASAGSSTSAAKADHKHAMPAQYTHPTGDGSSHIPATGTSNNGKVLKAGSTANSAVWGQVDYSELSGKPSLAPSNANYGLNTLVGDSGETSVNCESVGTTELHIHGTNGLTVTIDQSDNVEQMPSLSAVISLDICDGGTF